MVSQLGHLGMEGIPVHSVKTCLLKACCVPDTVQAAWQTAVSKRVPVLRVFRCAGLGGEGGRGDELGGWVGTDNKPAKQEDITSHRDGRFEENENRMKRWWQAAQVLF